MLKNINNKPVPKSINNKEITIDYLMENAVFSYSQEDLKNIIGFARFNPVLKSDQRFRNQLIRGSWYPIEKMSNEEHGFFNLVGYKKSHFSLFDQIVALPNHEDKFEDLKLTLPKVKKYWNDKLKEYEKLKKEQEELEEKIKKENKEYKEIKNKLGRQPDKILYVNRYLRKKIKESELFKILLLDENLRNKFKKDLDFRLKRIELFNSIPKDKYFRYYFHNNFEIKNIHKLKRIKNKIESFDFSSDKDLKLLEREERFSERKASIFDILSKKTEEMSNKVFKYKKRKI